MRTTCAGFLSERPSAAGATAAHIRRRPGGIHLSCEAVWRCAADGFRHGRYSEILPYPPAYARPMEDTGNPPHARGGKNPDAKVCFFNLSGDARALPIPIHVGIPPRAGRCKRSLGEA